MCGDPQDQTPYISTQGSDSVCLAMMSFLCFLSFSNNRVGGRSRRGFMSLDTLSSGYLALRDTYRSLRPVLR